MKITESLSIEKWGKLDYQLLDKENGEDDLAIYLSIDDIILLQKVLEETIATDNTLQIELSELDAGQVGPR